MDLFCDVQRIEYFEFLRAAGESANVAARNCSAIAQYHCATSDRFKV
jgi:hypothetical protein